MYVCMYICIYVCIYMYIYIERVIMVKKPTYLRNNFNSRIYEFIAFTFLLKPLNKIFFTIFTVKFKQKLKNLVGKKILSVNDS